MRAMRPRIVPLVLLFAMVLAAFRSALFTDSSLVRETMPGLDGTSNGDVDDTADDNAATAASAATAQESGANDESAFTFPSDELLLDFCKNESRRGERPGVAPGVPVQYIHIPKAGGTTLQENMEAWARSHSVKVLLHDGDHEGVWRCNDVQRGLLIGHRGFGYCQRMERNYGARAFYVVALREPVSRFRSLFDYIMSNNFWFFRDYHRRWDGRQLSDLVVEYNDTLHLGLPANHPKMWGPLRFWSLSRQQSSFMCVFGELPNARKLTRLLARLAPGAAGTALRLKTTLRRIKLPSAPSPISCAPTPW